MKRVTGGLYWFFVTFMVSIAMMATASAQHEHGTDGFVSGMHAAMAVMMKDMESAPVTGDPDKDFLAMMIPHHEGAVEMARLVLVTSTGEARVNRIVAAHDVGKAINPQNVEGQIQGGVGMGLGFALMEEFLPGKTASMGDYHIPTSLDMPEIIPIIVEDQEPTGPYGAKGVGEPALIPTSPAILNAIADALGERIFRLPAPHPERVREVVRRKATDKAG